MPRTRKTAQTAEIAEDVVVPMQPGIEEQPHVDQPEEPAQTAPVDEQAQPEEAPEAQARYRGPALNRVELIGRVASDPMLRPTSSGTPVGYFRVATNGLKQSDTEFHQCTVFGKTAQFAGQYLTKGRLVYLDGRLQTRAFDDRDGVRRYMTSIAVNRLQVLDSRRRDEQDEQ